MKPRVIILAPRYTVIERGVETFTKNLVSRLSLDFEFDIRSRKNTWCVIGLGTEVEMMTFALGVLPHLLLTACDIIFCQSGFWGMLVAKLVSLVKSNKTIYRSAGGCEPWIVRCGPDVYVATTPQIAEWVKSQDGGIQVELIPNGVDRTMFKTSGMKYRLSGRKPIVLCVAADEPAKRVELARSAAKLASMSFVHVGGKYRVSHSEMPKCYRGCNVFTLPSLDEPFGIVYLEAMACGVPVVAPDDESRRFVVGKNGILCDVTDSKKYARALKMACSVKIKFDEKFDWKNVALRYKELFLRVL